MSRLPHRILIAILVLLFSPSISPALASPASGLWRTPEDDGTVEIYDCGSKLCGKVVGSSELAANPDLKDVNNENASLRQRPIKGLNVVSGFAGGPKSWSGGQLYRPKNGRSYSGELDLVDNSTLKVRGCLFMGLCETQTWQRIR